MGLTGVAGVLAGALGLAWAEAHQRRSSADQSSGGTTTHLSRQTETPRAGWQRRVADSGVTFAELPGVCWANSFVSAALPDVWIRRLGLDEPYWNEAASYQLSDEGAWKIESAAFELHSMLLEAVDEVRSLSRPAAPHLRHLVLPLRS